MNILSEFQVSKLAKIIELELKEELNIEDIGHKNRLEIEARLSLMSVDNYDNIVNKVKEYIKIN